MSEIFTIHDESYSLVNCYSCGVRFLIPTILNKAALDNRGPNGRNIYCPNGHEWHYLGKTEAEKLRDERDRLVQRIAQKDDEIRDREREVAAQKGLVTKLKKRASAGTCPCCQRQFENMVRHMKTKHPDFAKPELKVVSGG